MRLHASQIARLRARTFAVLGLSAAPLAFAACREGGPGPGPQAPDVTPSASVTPAATAPVATSAPVADAASGAAVGADDAGPLVATVTPEMVLPRPTCPTGEFCESGSKQKKPGAAEAAPAPYGRCWAHSPNPKERPGPTNGGARVVTFSEALTKTAREKDADACCYTWWVPCPGGRALRDAEGEACVAAATTRRDWIDDALAIDPLRDAALAATWAEDAAFEHASIGAFARLTLDLLAFGAPADLVTAAQAATADEIAHARVAYAFASAYGGVPVGPSALAVEAPRASSIAALARASLEDGCIGEAWAALTLRARAESARAAGRTREARALLAIADDENRHVDLAWRIIAWAMRVAPDAVAPVLRDARASLLVEGSARREHALVSGAIVPCVDALLASAA